MLTQAREDAFVKLHAFEYPVHERAAVINAIYHAIGIRLGKFPMRPEDVPHTLTDRVASRAAN